VSKNLAKCNDAKKNAFMAFELFSNLHRVAMPIGTPNFVAIFPVYFCSKEIMTPGVSLTSGVSINICYLECMTIASER
jgi:hypothetical protein